MIVETKKKVWAYLQALLVTHGLRTDEESRKKGARKGGGGGKAERERHIREKEMKKGKGDLKRGTRKY